MTLAQGNSDLHKIWGLPDAESFIESVELLLINSKTTDGNDQTFVEGFAVKIKEESYLSVLKSAFPAHPIVSWTSINDLDGWYRGKYSQPMTLAQGNSDLHKIWGLPDAESSVESAELLLRVRQPITGDTEARQQFALWGTIAHNRLDEIVKKSDDSPSWWLEQLQVIDTGNQKGAHTIWNPELKNANKKPGDGILVAHPDTGYTDHPALAGRLKGDPVAKKFGKNFVERDPVTDAPTDDAKDPLTKHSLLDFPGHGTGTGSVITSATKIKKKPSDPNAPEWDSCVAPGATLLPLRVSESVIHLSFSNLSEALAEAIAQKADVISMSLGGPIGSALLDAQIEAALEAGIILVAAAGNYAPTVVFPALVPGVLACSASNVLKAPWRFSGMGEAVAITAPGELVWRASPTQAPNAALYSTGSGTSFATACVAGLAALWLSHHGKDKLRADYPGSLLPFAFRWCLEKAVTRLDRVKWGFGAGIPNATELLQRDLPQKDEVVTLRTKLQQKNPGDTISLPINSWWSILTLPTLAEAPQADPAPLGNRAAALQRFVAELTTAWQATVGKLDPDWNRQLSLDLSELTVLAVTDPGLSIALARVAAQDRRKVSPRALRRYLLHPSRQSQLSTALRDRLIEQQKADNASYLAKYGETLQAPVLMPVGEEKSEKPSRPFVKEPPRIRRLKAYAFDPSLATRTDTVLVNEIIVPVVFEPDLQPGPIGEYLEVIDVDPASDCVYAPVNLNDPWVLAEDGLARSESNPMFHQQMVYAVAMKTIGHFEDALGRPIFWSPLRTWNEESGDNVRAENYPGYDPKNPADLFVQRLRLYPHALREQNAYYSPQKRAILFGYFPADESDPGGIYPGGMVFTCLAHDIIAHEMTHAILDGMHVYFTDDTNPDVFAFHEAFADIVALFQRFSYPTLLHDQIARTRGKLDSGTLLSQLALQFGQATGRRSALRDALGYVVSKAQNTENAEKEVAFNEETVMEWRRFKANPSDLAREMEPHRRGSFLVAAVFDAYLSIYEDRIRDLRRIATGGTGILPDGDLHPDLVNRMADEAARSARHVLRMCIRAMDYTPPVDITFGEFLRALITADYDLVPEDLRRYRVAFIEAFRKWGIYPREVRTLSEETLRWSPPPQDINASLFPRAADSNVESDDDKDPTTREERRALRLARRLLLKWKPGAPREDIFERTLTAQAKLHDYLKKEQHNKDIQTIFEGIDLSQNFEVTNMRPARRVGPSGEFLTELVVEIIQEQKGQEKGLPYPFRGGITLIVSMDDDSFAVRYAIRKRAHNTPRQAEQRTYLLGASADADKAAEYSSVNLPADWKATRTYDREGMRASSCNCRAEDIAAALKKKAEKEAKKKLETKEPFALLHRP
ncbi:MAG: S8 family serine peptidase [Armatimonas sp.]